MVAKTYGIYDGVQKEYVRTFVAQNDDDAARAAEYIVREKGFDDLSGKDRSIFHLYDVDTSNGQIVNNDIHPVCNLSTYIEKRKSEEMEKILRSKLATEQFIQEVKETILAQVSHEVSFDVRTKDSNA